MEKCEIEMNALDELNKGSCMGKDALRFTLDKVKNEKMKEELFELYGKYNEMCDKISRLYF